MRVKAAMERIRKNQLIFGTSFTATTANLQEITGREIMEENSRGCALFERRENMEALLRKG